MTPYDESAERALLGCLLQYPETVLVTSKLQPAMFYLDSHQRIFRGVAAVAERTGSFDVLMVRDELRKAGDLDAIGNLGYLMDLQDGIPRGMQPEYHIGKVVEAWRARRGLELCQNYGKRLESRDGDAAEALSDMQADVFDALMDGNSRPDPHVRFHTVPLLNELNQTDRPPGAPYGIPRLDEISGGYRPKHVTTVGAWSGHGKSSLMCQTVAHCCRRGDGADIFSYEMAREDVLHRLWSIESGVPYSAIYHRRLDATQHRYVKEAAYRIAEWNLRIHDDAGMTLSQMAAQMRLSARRSSANLFCVDYAQIVPTSGKGSEDNRLRVSEVSRTLTALMKSEGTHLMLLSQLSKPNGPPRPPRLSDLRETGQLENDAHIVLLLHRPWDEQTGGNSNGAEIIIPKQRNGPTGTIPSAFNPKTLTFE